MQTIKKYSVSLSNDSVIFDSCDFDSFNAALDWSLGRGNHYTADITCGNIRWLFSVRTDTISYYDGLSWVRVKKEDVQKECGFVLDPEYL